MRHIVDRLGAAFLFTAVAASPALAQNAPGAPQISRPMLCKHDYRFGKITAQYRGNYSAEGGAMRFRSAQVRFQVPAWELRWNSVLLVRRPANPTLNLMFDEAGQPTGNWSFLAGKVQFTEHVHQIDYTWKRGNQQFVRKGWWDEEGRFGDSPVASLYAKDGAAWFDGQVSVLVTNNENREVLTAKYSLSVAALRAEAKRVASEQRTRFDAVPLPESRWKYPEGCEAPIKFF